MTFGPRGPSSLFEPKGKAPPPKTQSEKKKQCKPRSCWAPRSMVAQGGVHSVQSISYHYGQLYVHACHPCTLAWCRPSLLRNHPQRVPGFSSSLRALAGPSGAAGLGIWGYRGKITHCVPLRAGMFQEALPADRIAETGLGNRFGRSWVQGRALLRWYWEELS